MAAPSPARRAAAEILLAVEAREAWASELLRSRASGLSAADRALTSELVLGSLRRQGWLDHVLTPILARRGHNLLRLDAGLRMTLRLGLYQLIWLERIPAAVAVDQNVGLARALRLSSGAGLINAVLRAALRLPELRAGRELRAFPPDWKQAEFLARLSHPEWLLRRWRARWGDAAALEIAAYGDTAPALHLCVHPQLDSGEVQAELASERIETEPLWLRGALRVQSGDPTASDCFRRRRVWIQAVGSQFMAWLLLAAGAPAVSSQISAQALPWIADACAAPGGKAAILAAQNGPLLALELHPRRAANMRRRFPAAGWPGLHLAAADAARDWPAAAPFSRILLDAPCTGTGTLARNPELRWRLSASDPERLAVTQAALLGSSLRQAAPAARLLYSVCSLEGEEGEGVLERVLDTAPGWMPSPFETVLERMHAGGRILTTPAELRLVGPNLILLPGPESGGGFFAALLSRGV